MVESRESKGEEECPIISQVNLFVAIIEEIKSRSKGKTNYDIILTEEWKNNQEEIYKRILSFFMTITSKNGLPKNRLYNRGRKESNYRYKDKEESSLRCQVEGNSCNETTTIESKPKIYSNLSHEAPEFIPKSRKPTTQTSIQPPTIKLVPINPSEPKSNVTSVVRNVKKDKESSRSTEIQRQEEIDAGLSRQQTGFRLLNPQPSQVNVRGVPTSPPSHNYNTRRQQNIKKDNDNYTTNDGRILHPVEANRLRQQPQEQQNQSETTTNRGIPNLQALVDFHLDPTLTPRQRRIENEYQRLYGSTPNPLLQPPSPMNQYYSYQPAGAVALPQAHQVQINPMQVVHTIPGAANVMQPPLTMTTPVVYTQQGLISPYKQQQPQQPSYPVQQFRSYPSPKHCTFCKSLGYSSDMYMTHSVRNPFNNKAICPNLRKIKCDQCQATGDNAHHETECPYNLIRKATDTISSTSTLSSTTTSSSSKSESTSIKPIISRKVSFTASIEKIDDKIKNVRFI